MAFLDETRLQYLWNKIKYRFIGYYTPQMFGAKADGTTDDTAAIQAAIDATFSSGKMRVYFPAGTYKITSPLLLTTSTNASVDGQRWWDGHGVELFGDSRSTSIIVKSGNGTWTEPSSVIHETEAERAFMQDGAIDSTLILTGLGTGIHIHDLYVKNESNGTITYGIYGSRSRTTIERVNVNTKTRGINLYSFFNTVRDVRFNGTEKILIIGQGTSTTIEKLYVSGVSNPYVISSSYTNLLNVCADNCTGTIFDICAYNAVLTGCGSESPGAQYYIKTGYNGGLTINGFFAYRQDGSGGAAVADSAILRIDGACNVSLNDLFVLDKSTSTEQTYLLSAYSNATVDLHFSGLRVVSTSSAATKPAYKLFSEAPKSDSRIQLNIDGLCGMFALDGKNLIPCEEYQSDARKYLSDTVKNNAVVSEKLFAGVTRYDEDAKKIKWWNGNKWIYPAIAPISAEDAAFLTCADVVYGDLPKFTNLFSTSDANYAAGNRLSGSGTLSTDIRTYTMFVTGYIAVPARGTVRVRCPAGTYSAAPGTTWVVLAPYTNTSGTLHGNPLYTVDSACIVDSDGLGFTWTSTWNTAIYVRIVGNGSTSGFVVTVNEAIAYDTVVVGGGISLHDNVKITTANLPIVTAADNGKILKVVDGQWMLVKC